MALGYLGDDRAVEPLIAYLESGVGAISFNSYFGRSVVTWALGILVSYSGNHRALAYLEDTLGGDKVWPERIKWRCSFFTSSAEMQEDLNARAIHGLAYSGRPSARAALEGFRSRLDPKKSARDANLSRSVDDALQAHQTIVAQGPTAFCRP